MKNLKQFLVLSAAAILLFTACEKEKITYYKTIGEGYIFMCDSLGSVLYPLEGGKVSVLTNFDERRGNFLESEPIEYFFSDATGKYQVRFIKQKQNWGNAERYEFYIQYYVYENGKWFGGATNFTIGADEVKNNQYTIDLDTIKIVYK